MGEEMEKVEVGLVALDRRQALDPVSYDVMEIDPAPGEWPFGRGRE